MVADGRQEKGVSEKKRLGKTRISRMMTELEEQGRKMSIVSMN